MLKDMRTEKAEWDIDLVSMVRYHVLDNHTHTALRLWDLTRARTYMDRIILYRSYELNDSGPDGPLWQFFREASIEVRGLAI